MKRKDKHCRRDPEHGRQLLNFLEAAHPGFDAIKMNNQDLHDEKDDHRDHLLGAYLLNAGAATPKVLLPNAFIVQDLALVDGCRTLLDISGIRCPLSATWPGGIGGSSFWMQTDEESTG
jgi:hypothetical protein